MAPLISDSNALEKDVPENPVLSVVIPVYNGARHLQEAVDSVLCQTYAPIEVIAIDDGSTDSSPEILASYGDKIRVIRQENLGVSHARNAGLAAAQGEFIAFLDQDDAWRTEKIERQLREFQIDSDVGFVHCAAAYFDDTQKRFVDRFNGKSSEDLIGNCYERLLLGNGVMNCSVVVRRSVLDEAGPFDAGICGNTVQDYDLWLRCARITKFAYCPEELVIYRLHPAQGMWNVKECHRQLVAVLEHHVGPSEQVSSPELRNHFSEIFSQLAIEYLDDHERTEARHYLRRSLRLRWSSRNAVIYATSYMPIFLIDSIRFGRSRLRRIFRGEVHSRIPVWTGRVNNGI